MTPEELLLAELKSVMDDASKSIASDEDNEALEILGLMSKAFDEQDDTNCHLYAMKVITMDEYHSESSEATVVPRLTEPQDGDQVAGGKVTHLVTTDTIDDLLIGVSDQESMMLIGYKENPVGLFARTNYPDGNRFTIMATPSHVVTERRPTTGQVVTKCYRSDGDKPDDLETYTESEQDLIRNLWQGLVMPMQFRKNYPEAYEALAKEIEAKWRERLGDDPTE